MSSVEFESVAELAGTKPGHSAVHKPDAPPDFTVSPSLASRGDDRWPAYEIKFVIPNEFASKLETYFESRLQADPNAQGGGDVGRYPTTTLYCDTHDFDTYFRRGAFARSKFRLRRYGRDDLVFLERKSKHGIRVKKHRSQIPTLELQRIAGELVGSDWNGDWFRKQIVARALSPVLAVRYARTAFVDSHENHPIRVTFDRDIAGLRTNQWNVEPFHGGHSILADLVIGEFKFRGPMPNLFKSTIEEFRLSMTSASKYRLCLDAAGGPVQEGRDHV